MVTSESDEPRLSDEAEELLADWPMPDRALSDWEALARAVDAIIRVAQIGETPDLLLEAPLPEVLDETADAGRRSHPRMKRPSQGSLTRLAQASVDKADAAFQRDESAQALLSQAVRARAEARAQSATRPLPQRPDAAATAGVPASSAHPASSNIRSAARRHERGMWFGIAFGVLGMAAAGFMYVSTNQNRMAPDGLARVVRPQTVAPVPGRTRELGNADREEAASERQQVVSVEDISLEGDQAAQTPPKRVALRPTPNAPTQASKATAAGPTVRGAPPLAARPAAGPSEPGMVMADSRGTGLPDRPSTGAVQVAIGSVMGAARACVAGQPSASQAAVTFGSDGRVKGVAVTGPAVGTSAEACVKSALRGARLQPFSRPNFVITLSIRPQ